MAKKKITLGGLANLITDGFAASDKKFAALAEDIADIRKDMATKDDVRDIIRKEVPHIVREETNDLREELTSVRRDLDGLTEKIDNLAGLPKEIDHALERIAMIEKHPAIHRRVA